MKIIILHGISGSGKSTYAATIRDKSLVVSADHFFTDRAGVFRYDGTKVQAAHNACLRRFIGALICDDNDGEHRGFDGDAIIVDNTNCREVEAVPYVRLGQAFNAVVEHCVFPRGLGHDFIEASRYLARPEGPSPMGVMELSKSGASKAPYDTMVVQSENLLKLLREWPRNWNKPKFIAVHRRPF